MAPEHDSDMEEHYKLSCKTSGPPSPQQRSVEELLQEFRIREILLITPAARKCNACKDRQCQGHDRPFKTMDPKRFYEISVYNKLKEVGRNTNIVIKGFFIANSCIELNHLESHQDYSVNPVKVYPDDNKGKFYCWMWISSFTYLCTSVNEKRIDKWADLRQKILEKAGVNHIIPPDSGKLIILFGRKYYQEDYMVDKILKEIVHPFGVNGCLSLLSVFLATSKDFQKWKDWCNLLGQQICEFIKSGNITYKNFFDFFSSNRNINSFISNNSNIVTVNLVSKDAILCSR